MNQDLIFFAMSDVPVLNIIMAIVIVTDFIVTKQL
jgi:hypothetical protein